MTRSHPCGAWHLSRFILYRDCAVAETQLESLVRHRNTLRIAGSVLGMIRWRRNTKALHFVKQSSALQAESRSCSSWTSELPIGALASGENLYAHLLFERGV